MPQRTLATVRTHTTPPSPVRPVQSLHRGDTHCGAVPTRTQILLAISDCGTLTDTRLYVRPARHPAAISSGQTAKPSILMPPSASMSLSCAASKLSSSHTHGVAQLLLHQAVHQDHTHATNATVSTRQLVKQCQTHVPLHLSAPALQSSISLPCQKYHPGRSVHCVCAWVHSCAVLHAAKRGRSPSYIQSNNPRKAIPEAKQSTQRNLEDSQSSQQMHTVCVCMYRPRWCGDSTRDRQSDTSLTDRSCPVEST